MIKKRNVCLKHFSDFKQKKLGCDYTNTTYKFIDDDTTYQGEPDIMYQSFVVIKDTCQFWTHGKILTFATSEDVETMENVMSSSLNDLNERLETLHEEKQDVIDDLETIREGSLREISKSAIGLGNVDNTSDMDKPISTAVQTALNAKATSASLGSATTRITALETALAQANETIASQSTRIDELEEVVSSSLTDLNERLEALES